ncbi:MAG: sulfurtransferase-like selenium metabolism protein YedF [Dehalococcoidia bacterium]|nr:sulfurtransferase-like selenium metabolism protein YedF [Dehalococcoidia bacterium]
MIKELDCRKQGCPQPIIDTKRALEAGNDELRVVVDSIVSRDNVRRFASSQGHKVEIEDKGGGLYHLNITRNPEAVVRPAGAAPEAGNVAGGVVVFITTDKLGEGDERLGAILMKAFLNTLHDSEPKPAMIMFINNGVRLTTEGSEMLDSLEALTHDGVQIMSCGTCLTYYDIMNKLKIGIVGNMYDIVNVMLEAEKVIKI